MVARARRCAGRMTAAPPEERGREFRGSAGTPWLRRFANRVREARWWSIEAKRPYALCALNGPTDPDSASFSRSSTSAPVAAPPPTGDLCTVQPRRALITADRLARVPVDLDVNDPHPALIDDLDDQRVGICPADAADAQVSVQRRQLSFDSKAGVACGHRPSAIYVA